MKVSSSLKSSLSILPAKISSSNDRNPPEQLLMMCLSFPASPCTSLTTWITPLGSVAFARRSPSWVSTLSRLGNFSARACNKARFVGTLRRSAPCRSSSIDSSLSSSRVPRRRYQRPDISFPPTKSHPKPASWPRLPETRRSYWHDRPLLQAVAAQLHRRGHE